MNKLKIEEDGRMTFEQERLFNRLKKCCITTENTEAAKSVPLTDDQIRELAKQWAGAE